MWGAHKHMKWTDKWTDCKVWTQLDYYAGLLTQELLHLLHTHVDVDSGVVVVVVVDAYGAARAGQAAGPFQQQQEEEAPQPPEHRVRPHSGLGRAAGAADQPQHNDGGCLARCCSRCSQRISFSSVSEINPGRQHYELLQAPTLLLTIVFLGGFLSFRGSWSGLS